MFPLRASNRFSWDHRAFTLQTRLFSCRAPTPKDNDTSMEVQNILTFRMSKSDQAGTAIITKGNGLIVNGL